jgi:hypothetical protein
MAAATSVQQMTVPTEACDAPPTTCSARVLIANGSSQPAKFAPAAAAPSNTRRAQYLALKTCRGNPMESRRHRRRPTPSITVPSGHTQPQNSAPNTAVRTSNPRAIHP